MSSPKFILFFLFLCYYTSSISQDNGCTQNHVWNPWMDYNTSNHLQELENEIGKAPADSIGKFETRLLKEISGHNVYLVLRSHEIFHDRYLELQEIANAYHHAEKAYSYLTDDMKNSFFGVELIVNLGNMFLETENYEEAARVYIEALSYLNQFCNQPHEFKFYIYNQIAHSKKAAHDNDLALEYYNKACNEALGLENNLWLASANNNIGLHYYDSGDFEDALFYYQNALPYLKLEDLEHQHLSLAIKENIARTLFRKKLFQQSDGLFEEISKERLKLNDSMGYIQALFPRLYFSLMGWTETEGEPIFKEIDAFYEQHPEFKESYEINTGEYYRLKVLFNKDPNDFQKTWENVVDYIRFMSSKFQHEKEASNHTLKGYTLLLENEYKNKLKLETQLREASEKSLMATQRNTYFLITILVLISLLSLILLRNKNLKQKRVELDNLNAKLSIEKFHLENLNLASKLVSRNKDLNSVVMDNRFRHDFNKEVYDKLCQIKKYRNLDTIRKNLSELIFDFKTQIDVEDRLDHLKSDLDKVNNKFTEILIKHYPELTKTEREICSLIRLNLSIKEIANARSSSVDSVKMARHRIRKKMNLDSEVELEWFIQQL